MNRALLIPLAAVAGGLPIALGIFRYMLILPENTRDGIFTALGGTMLLFVGGAGWGVRELYLHFKKYETIRRRGEIARGRPRKGKRAAGKSFAGPVPRPPRK